MSVRGTTVWQVPSVSVAVYSLGGNRVARDILVTDTLTVQDVSAAFGDTDVLVAGAGLEQRLSCNGEMLDPQRCVSTLIDDDARELSLSMVRSPTSDVQNFVVAWNALVESDEDTVDAAMGEVCDLMFKLKDKLAAVCAYFADALSHPNPYVRKYAGLGFQCIFITDRVNLGPSHDHYVSLLIEQLKRERNTKVFESLSYAYGRAAPDQMHMYFQTCLHSFAYDESTDSPAVEQLIVFEQIAQHHQVLKTSGEMRQCMVDDFERLLTKYPSGRKEVSDARWAVLRTMRRLSPDVFRQTMFADLADNGVWNATLHRLERRLLAEKLLHPNGEQTHDGNDVVFPVPTSDCIRITEPLDCKFDGVPWAVFPAAPCLESEDSHRKTTVVNLIQKQREIIFDCRTQGSKKIRRRYDPLDGWLFPQRHVDSTSAGGSKSVVDTSFPPEV